MSPKLDETSLLAQKVARLETQVIYMEKNIDRLSVSIDKLASSLQPISEFVQKNQGRTSILGKIYTLAVSIVCVYFGFLLRKD